VPWLTTTLLLDRLRENDETVWTDFVERFREPIATFARGLGLSADEAEDVAQETLADFLRALRDGQYDREKGRLQSWLFGIAHRRVLNAVRRRPREQQGPGTAGRTTFFSALPDSGAALVTWDTTWKRAMVDHCLGQLQSEMEPTTIRAFEMFAIRNRPAADVAGDLGITRNAVFLAKRRVLKRLRELTDEFELE